MEQNIQNNPLKIYYNRNLYFLMYSIAHNKKKNHLVYVYNLLTEHYNISLRNKISCYLLLHVAVIIIQIEFNDFM